MLKTVVFPEQLQYAHYCKYLYYKGEFFGRVGDFKNSFKYMGEAIRKAPQMTKDSGKGVKSFVLRARRHHTLLELLMNELPTPQLFEKHPELERYKNLVRMVSNGRKQ